MRSPRWFRTFILVVGDLCMMYAGLFFALLLRYRSAFYEEFVAYHVVAFSITFAVSLGILYIAGLYRPSRLRNSLDFFKTLFLVFVINFLIAVSIFYLVPIFGIAPKTNLVLSTAFFVIFETAWRHTFNRRAMATASKLRVLSFGSGEVEKKITETISASPQLGYAIAAQVENESIFPETVPALIKTYRPDLVIIPRHIKKDSSLARVFYGLLVSGILVKDSASFYEDLFKSVPVSDLEEAWFLENLSDHQRFYDHIKRALEFCGALIAFIIFSPVLLLIALVVKATSHGPALIRQKRVGRGGAPFTLYKFRSMVALSPDGLAETNGAQWAHPKDQRVTGLGKFLRASHLDELPQLMNIIKGELSFVGPRPERPEFVAVLKEKIPFYETRHLIQPGFTGWAQVNYRYGATVEDAMEKLQYDLYYLKNRSIVLDAAILLRTVRFFFVNE